MTIEAELARIADALEKIAGQEATAPKQSSESPAPEKAASKSESKARKPRSSSKTSKKPDAPAKEEGDAGPSLDAVRKALTALQKRETPAAARAILSDVAGVTTLSKLKPDQYQEIIDAAESS